MIDKFGENFNEDVLQWKENKEYGCKLDLHISSIKEEIVAMKREQEETIIIAGSLDVDIFLPDIECSSIPQTRNEEDTLSTDINKTELKKRVNAKLGGKFEENMFDETLPAIHYAHVDVPGYQIIGDNVDFLVKAKHMSSTKQNDSVHWFNLNGILDRVSGHEYLNDKPIKSIREVENIHFLHQRITKISCTISFHLCLGLLSQEFQHFNMCSKRQLYGTFHIAIHQLWEQNQIRYKTKSSIIYMYQYSYFGFYLVYIAITRSQGLRGEEHIQE